MYVSFVFSALFTIPLVISCESEHGKATCLGDWGRFFFHCTLAYCVMVSMSVLHCGDLGLNPDLGLWNLTLLISTLKVPLDSNYSMDGLNVLPSFRSLCLSDLVSCWQFKGWVDGVCVLCVCVCLCGSGSGSGSGSQVLVVVSAVAITIKKVNI